MKALLCVALCLLNLCAALPEAGVVVQGQANIASNGVDMIITQSTERATIEWSKFNVGAQNSVIFQQPSSASIALNRVTGTELSKIAGKITANGQVVLINPNGVIFANGSTVNVGGLLATSYQMNQTNPDTYELQKNSSKILNEGYITSDRDVILLGTQVENSGNIKAPGKAVLSGDNESETLYLTDGNLKFQVAKNMLPTDGSAVPFTNLVTSSVNHTGIIEAGDITTNNAGAVILCGADETNVSGIIKCPAGTVHIAGKAIALTDTTIDVSGENQGGTINVGGGFQGLQLNDKKNSVKVFVDKNSKLTADSETGNAGKVIMWSEAETYFAGLASANATNKNRNGGLIEVSSRGKLGMPSSAKISAAGLNGNVLFDPGTLTVVPNAGNNDAMLPNVNATDPNAYTISAVALMAVGANITLQADDTIDLSATAFIGLQPGVNLTMITNMLNGAGANIAAANGDITITAPGGSTLFDLSTTNAGNITVNGPINNGASPLAISTFAGAITLNGDVTTANQNVALTSDSGNITNQAINAGTGLVTRTTNLPGVLTPANTSPPVVTPQTTATRFSDPTQQQADKDSTKALRGAFNTANKPGSQGNNEGERTLEHQSGRDGAGSLFSNETTADEKNYGDAKNEAKYMQIDPNIMMQSFSETLSRLGMLPPAAPKASPQAVPVPKASPAVEVKGGGTPSAKTTHF